MSKEIVNEVKKFAIEEFEKPTTQNKIALEDHFVIVVKYALELAELEKADKEVVEIAAWLHDITSIMGYHENHHISGSKVAEELLTRLNYPKDKIEEVNHCILTHRGSVPLKKETKEAQILADADAMAHFDRFGSLVKFLGKRETLAKLERSYNKLSENAKPLVKEKLEEARRELK